MMIRSEIELLMARQLLEWPLAEKNYQSLGRVLVKNIDLGGFCVQVQFNPERMVSSSAKVDAKSIGERPCFLCPANLPKEQAGVLWGDGYQVLVNPFPIFPQHFTVPLLHHVPQSIHGRMGDMLRLAANLPAYTVFYNGPRCGASAPDHFHFQAGLKGVMPIEADYRQREWAELLGAVNGVEVFHWPGYLRGVATFAGDDAAGVESCVEHLLERLPVGADSGGEPMLNILAYWEAGKYVVHVFPRIKHRPDCFFAEGEGQVMMSPASVDMGGVWITPRKEDFDKMDDLLVKSIFNEVCMDTKTVASVLRQLL